MKERIVRYSKAELDKMKGRTNHAQVHTTSDTEIERQVKNDPDSYIPTEEELKAFQPVNKGNKK